MRLPLEWLKEFVTVKLTPQQLAERLTMAGLEIGAIEQTENGPVFDIEITPNRSDWLSIIGIAREISAITGERLNLHSAQGSGLRAQSKSRKPPAPSPQPQASLAIHIDDRKGCLRYIGRLIRGVAVAPSPDWMQRRLIACGTRPINNIVDITNYVLFEYGQPLHAFDADHLAENTICVRRAVAGEPVTALDGITRKLTNDILVIADAKQPVAIAGIMGGLVSGVKSQTRNIILESALFDPIIVRRAGRKLGLTSESSYRFERGVDPEGVLAASQRAAQLILELAGGTEETVKDVGTPAKRRAAITVEPIKAQQWLGLPVNSAMLRTTFARLGCRVASAGASAPVSVVPPSYRRDLNREVDFYEEIARVIGYDKIKTTVPVVSLINPDALKVSSFSLTHHLRETCAGFGLQEAVTWSLIAESELACCGYSAKAATKLANPLSQDHAFLRPSLLAGLMRTLRHNAARGTANVSIFELGRVWENETESSHLAILISGEWFPDWNTTRQTASFWVLKGLLQGLVQQVTGLGMEMTLAAYPWSEPGESAKIIFDERALGMAGEISGKALEAYDLKKPAWFGEINVDVLLSVPRRAARVSPPPEFPPVKRDLSVLLDQKIIYHDVEQTIREAAGALAGQVELIDRFTGKQVPEGKYSVTFSIEYRDPTRTLTAAEAEAAHNRVTEALTGQLGAIRR